MERVRGCLHIFALYFLEFSQRIGGFRTCLRCVSLELAEIFPPQALLLGGVDGFDETRRRERNGNGNPCDPRCPVDTWAVSWNGGTPKWMVHHGTSYKMDDLGVPKPSCWSVVIHSGETILNTSFYVQLWSRFRAGLWSPEIVSMILQPDSTILHPPTSILFLECRDLHQSRQICPVHPSSKSLFSPFQLESSASKKQNHNTTYRYHLMYAPPPLSRTEQRTSQTRFLGPAPHSHHYKSEYIPILLGNCNTCLYHSWTDSLLTWAPPFSHMP